MNGNDDKAKKGTQAHFVTMIHPPNIELGKGWYSIDEGVIALNRKRRRCSPSTTVTS